MVARPKPWLITAVVTLAVVAWVSSGAPAAVSHAAETPAGPSTATVTPSSPAPSSSPSAPSPASTGTPNAAATLASNALAAARAADVNPDLVYVPRPSATPAQMAEVEDTGTVAPLYTANPAPMGLAYYGLNGTGTGPPTATTLTTTALKGSVDVNALSGEDLYQAEPASYSIQMNAVLTDVTLFGTPGYTFWTQDIATYFPSTQTLMLVTNIWNFSAVQLSPNYLYATSGEFSADDFSDYSALGFYYSEYNVTGVTEPFDLTLSMTSGLVPIYIGNSSYSANSVTFGASGSYANGAGTFSFQDLDQVTFSSVSTSAPTSVGTPAPYTASGTQLNPLGLTDDFELVICGPGGGSNVDIGDADVDLSLSYFNLATGGMYEIPAAYSYGGDTGETSTGASVDYFGNSPSSYYGWLTDGPSILTGLWGTGAPGGDGYLTLDETPANAFNFFTYNGAGGFSAPISFEQAFAPNFGVQNPTLYLMPGDYTILSELADYTAVTTQVVVTFGAPTSYSISLTANASRGVYTPLWAFSNSEVAELAVSGSGTPSAPYVLVNDQPAALSSNFGLYNDYGYPVFPGVFLDGTDSSVELAEPPSFSATTNDSQPWGDELPQTNDLQYWFWDVSNVSLVDAANIGGWFGAMGYSPLYFNSFDVVFYDSSNNLVAGNSFFTPSQGLLMYSALGASDYNTVWGNEFVQIDSTLGCPDSSQCDALLPYEFGLGLEVGEDSDLIYNNLFATPTTAWLLPLNLVTGQSELYSDTQWNIPSESASVVNYLVGGAALSTTPNSEAGFPTIPLTGSVVGGSTQGGNSWWDQGVSLNWDNGAVNSESTFYDENAPTLLAPLSALNGYPAAAAAQPGYSCNPAESYSEYAADPVGYYCSSYIYPGDNAPLTTITESVSFGAQDLPTGGTWDAAICGPSEKPPGGPPPSCGPSEKPPGGPPMGQATQSLWLYTSVTTTAAAVNILLPPQTYSWSIPVSPSGYAAEDQLGTLTVTGTPGSPVPPAPVTTTIASGYTETVTESGLPTGSVWWFNVTGRLPLSGTVTSSTSTITSILPDGTYSYAISGPRGYGVVPASGTFTVSGANPPEIPVTFTLGEVATLAVSPSAEWNPTEVGSAATISAGDTGGVPPYTYAWSGTVPGCTVASETSELFSCTPSMAGSYSISLTETDSTPSEATGSFMLTVDPALTVSPGASPNPTLAGEAVTVSAGDSGGVGPYSYWWSGTVPGCTVASETSESFRCTPTVTGSYPVSLTEIDSVGSRVTGSLLLTVNDPGGSMTVSPSATPNPVDVGQTTTISAGTSNGVGPYTYLWSGTVPGCPVTTETGSSFSCAPSAAGSDPVSVTATDSVGSRATGSSTLTVTADPSVSVVPAGPLSYDVGQTVSPLAAVVAYSGPNTASVEWYSSSSSPCSASSTNTGESGLTLTPSAASVGTTWYCAVVSDSGVPGYTSPSNAVEVTVDPALVVSPSATPNPAKIAQVTTISAGASGGRPSYTYAWSGALPAGCSFPSPGTASFTCTPGGSSQGSYAITVAVTDSNGNTVTNSFALTVSVPTLAVSPSQGPVGATYAVTGSGFSPSSGATVSFNGAVQKPGACSDGTFSGTMIKTDTSGDFSCTFTVPSESAGSYSVVGENTATSTLTAAYAFLVTTPKVTVVPGLGPIGATVTVAGTGFSVSSPVGLNFDGVAIPASSCTGGSSLTTGAGGAFSCTLKVPAGTTTLVVRATDVGGQEATTLFVVTIPVIAVVPSQGPVGATVQVAGAGFSVSSPVGLVFDGVTTSSCTSGSLTTSALGLFACVLKVPSGTVGTTVTATDVGGQKATGKFTVTTPQLTLSSASGPVGATVTVYGTGFSVSTTLKSLVFDGVSITKCTSGSLSTGGTGSFSCTFKVPSGTTTSTVTATDVGGQVATATFKVT